MDSNAIISIVSVSSGAFVSVFVVCASTYQAIRTAKENSKLRKFEIYSSKRFSVVSDLVSAYATLHDCDNYEDPKKFSAAAYNAMALFPNNDLRVCLTAMLLAVSQNDYRSNSSTDAAFIMLMSKLSTLLNKESTEQSANKKWPLRNLLNKDTQLHS